jgi:two-component system, chemotaxis family, CheB/CheR fusion protein
MMTERHRRGEPSRVAAPTPEQLTDAGRVYSDSDRIIDALRQPLIVLNEKLRVISANRAFYRTFAITPEEAVGRHLAAVGDHRLDVSALHDFLDLIQAESAVIEDYEIEIELPAQGRRVLLLNAQRIGGESIATRKILVTIYDVTEHRRAELALVSAKWRSERANLGKSRFLSAAGNDLRQPLQTLSLMRTILAKKIKDKEALELIARLNKTTDAMFLMLDTLIDINQLEAGIVRPKKVDFPINDLLEQLRIEFAYHAQAHGLIWHVVPCRLSIWSDPRLLEQIIRNFLSNALKYTERGKILLGCRRRGDKLRIEVWDTGTGLSERQLRAILAEFRQLDNPARERIRGLGLGLSIVQRLGSLLDHSIDVQSRPGKGSVFAIEAPIAREQPGVLPQRRQPGTVRQPTVRAGSSPQAETKVDMLQPTIFVVDDDASVREAMSRFLQEEGWLVEVYGSAEAFLQAYRPGREGCLVVDAWMPRIGGLELLERLQTEGGAPPAIVITGHADIPLAVRAMKAGAMAFLEKPVRYDELVVNIERALELTRNSAALSSLREATARRIARLTPRERQIMEMVVEGNPNKQIAYVLGISQRTVETHRAAAMKKIGARTLSELIHLTIAGSPPDTWRPV